MTLRSINWTKYLGRHPGADSAALWLSTFYLLIFFSFSIANTTHAIECSYLAEGAGVEFSSRGDCGEMIDPDRLLIHEAHLKRLSFANGLASVIADGKAFFVSKDGKAVRAWMLDNGADYFSEGLARTVAKGKFGYIDDNLNVVIPARYDFAFPFENGAAVVCNGCSLKPGVEHQEAEGGLWGTIDRSGKVLILLKHSRSKLMKMINEKAGT